jgi:hypothetical protein
MTAAVTKKSLTEKVKAHVAKALSPEVLRRRADAARAKIDTEKLIERINMHAMGKLEMSPTQLAAAQALLRKTLPDLVGVKAEIESSPVVFNFLIGTQPKQPKLINPKE